VIERKRATGIAVANFANQPREFLVRGRWIRWEPVGREGSTVIMTEEEVNSPDFKAELFTVRRA